MIHVRSTCSWPTTYNLVQAETSATAGGALP